MNMLHTANPQTHVAVEVGLNAAIVSVAEGDPRILTVRSDKDEPERLDGLPFGHFAPIAHRTLDIGLRTWVQSQTGLELGYVEQLYTFGDRGRIARPGDTSIHVVSVGYLALTQLGSVRELPGCAWRSWYESFPWEDFRHGKPRIVTEEIEPRLQQWAGASMNGEGSARSERVRMCFGLNGAAWDEEKVLERYELLYDAGLLTEAVRDGHESSVSWTNLPRFGLPLRYDHRRILATAMSRLRGKIKYRPLIFELMPGEFTLFELQRTVEAILGSQLHKQNFRRLVESAGLVEPTGEVRTHTGGRPAKLFHFRREVLVERPAPGVRVRAAIA